MTDGIKILYVDDEVNNLNSLKAVLRYDYEVFTATNAVNGLEVLTQHPEINIIFCDQRMPGKTGVEFLEEIRTSFPKAVRMLITGYSDMEAIIDAINKGNVLRYISKPWTPEDIKTAVEEAYKFYLTNSLLASKNEELQRAYDALDEFSYNVTHGLREPLLSVLGVVEIANSMENVPGELREILNIVFGSMLQLDNFIEHTHDHHRLKKNLLASDISFEHLVADVIHPYSVIARKNHIRFLYQILQKEHFHSDEVLLKIILNNLLSNAFKNPGSGAAKMVELSVAVGNGEVVISVTDNGVGNDDDSNEKTFSPSRKGFDLSLFNVKDALDKLGGTIESSSEADKGSTLTVVIPTKEV